ncbi:daptide biosynthesis intramembrane metalloprotease [Zhihengliuella sp. ISTPL4]|uniref:daptide biosynthesis intramembrane metalloprotease n=1 Tax=Zhihengliuella sp. ISTPL4 TaxID=2058657 RepID=UPI0013051BA3|nr:daptide biosynthesis intramembrane metalloprotease [Zhihengliuella sp. ISTPL4]
MTTARPRLPRRPGGRRREVLTADSRPALATGVAFESMGENAAWVATLDGVPSARLTPDVVELLTAMDGRTPVSVLRGRFAPGESDENFLRLVERFRANGLLHGSASRPPGRVTYRPPFTVQLATLRAPALFARLDRLVVPVPPRAALTALAAVLAAGVGAAILQAEDLRNVLVRPVPVVGFAVVVVALALATLLHEVAHGLALTRFGGRPRRAGFMLFYLTPAFFVDVTDGWRLGSRRRRVAIALAGPAVHALVAALALLTALAVPPSTARETLLLLSLSCTIVVLVNLIPFVRFDGYIAMMSALDEPNLRARAVRDGADSLARVLFGGSRPERSLDRWWSVPFGLCCLAAPIVLVLFAVVRTAQVLSGGGPVAGLVVLALEVVVLLVGAGLLARALTRVLRTGVSRLRFVAVNAVLAAGAVIVGMVPVPTAATLGFAVEGDRVVLVRGGGEAGAPVPDGARVLLSTRGILGNQLWGEGTVRSRPAEPVEVPIQALFPVREDGTAVPATAVAEVDVTGATRGLPPGGQARVELGTSALWQALWAAAVSPLSALTNEEERG